MIRILFTIVVSLVACLTVSAQGRVDTTLFSRYDHLFSLHDSDSVQVFYKVSGQMKLAARERGDMARYYDLLINEISYDAGRGKYIAALKKANSIMNDIQYDKSVGPEYYSHVYRSLGSIFEHRGNYQMASYYYERALLHLQPGEAGGADDSHRNLVGNLYAGLARVNLFYALDKSWQWNEKLNEQFGSDPHFRKPYLSHKARLYYYRNKPDSFLIVKRQFDRFLKDPQAPQYLYGETKLNIMENTLNGNRELALWQIDSLIAENPMVINAAMRIHDAMGRKDLALDDAYRWVHLQDSLNNELINGNLSELNVMLGTDKLQREAARERERWMLAVIGLFALSIVLLVMRYFTRMRHFKQMKAKNEELEKALDEARESDRMKTTFVQHISHEMRTPLNIITGNAQVIASPDFDLDPDDRKQLLEGIHEHTVAITSIVNDLLEMSLTSSKGRYNRDDIIIVNDLCRSVMLTKEEKNQGRLDISFNSELPDDFTIKNNYGGIERILVHLIGNAMKFTEKGSVQLQVRPSLRMGYIDFVVTDTGIGIAPELHEQIFEQFYKVDQFKQGMGIGLSMARKVAIGLGGALAVDPAYTGGARFVLTIPIGQ